MSKSRPYIITEDGRDIDLPSPASPMPQYPANEEARAMRKIDPLPSAPYAVRYVTDDGEYAVNFTYSLTRNLMDAQVWRLVKGHLWQRTGDTIHSPARGASEATEEMAARYVATAGEEN